MTDEPYYRVNIRCSTRRSPATTGPGPTFGFTSAGYYPRMDTTEPAVGIDNPIPADIAPDTPTQAEPEEENSTDRIARLMRQGRRRGGADAYDHLSLREQLGLIRNGW